MDFIAHLFINFVFLLPVLLPPFGILLLIVWVLFIVLSVRELYKKKWKFPTRVFSYLVPLACGFIGMMALASFFQDTAAPAASFGNGAMLLLNIFLIIYAVVKEKGWRMTITATGLFLALVSLNTYFLAEMSITGSWLQNNMEWIAVIGAVFTAWGICELFFRLPKSLRKGDKNLSNFQYMMSRYYYSPRILFLGVAALFTGLVYLFKIPNAEYVLAGGFFIFGSIFLVLGLALLISRKFKRIFWEYFYKSEFHRTDQPNMVFDLLVLAFGMYLLFFLVYPPFIGIG